ncbi:HAD-IA family hydrolase [Streptomyces cyaneofuscatus]|uniref:HAD-IA family hydrolase n=1 Tax=Streptomyces cyaneofuscatus TaxID=66883 RepID=UPI0033AF16E7
MLLAFDLMDTLLTDPYRSMYEQALGIPYEQYERLRPPGLWEQLECGEIDEAAYWGALRAVGLEADAAVFHRVRRAGYAWMSGMRELVAECAVAHPTVIASNYPVWIEEIGQTLLAGTGLDIHASCRLGVRKPSREFFRLLAERTGSAPHELVFVDDQPTNTAAVNDIGGLGLTFVSAAETRRRLIAHGLL